MGRVEGRKSLFPPPLAPAPRSSCMRSVVGCQGWPAPGGLSKEGTPVLSPEAATEGEKQQGQLCGNQRGFQCRKDPSKGTGRIMQPVTLKGGHFQRVKQACLEIFGGLQPAARFW